MRSVFVLVLTVLCLTGCGAVAGGAAPPAGSPPASPGAGFDVTATETTHSVTLRVGQTLAVVLHAKPGMTSWTNVQSDDQSVLLPIVNPGATAARGVTLAAFKAIAAGKVRIDATAAPECSPGTACPAYVILLTIDVTVTLG